MNWIDYWDTDRIFRSVMRRMTDYFFEASHRLLKYEKSDVVLDFGCGPGFLVQRLHNRVKEIHGVDTSAQMITECKEKFRNHPNVGFHTLPRDRYTDLSFLNHTRFTKTVVLSVVQYFRTVADVGDLIQSVAAISAPGACLLIADIPTHSVALLDTLELVKSGWQEGYLMECIRFLAQTRFSRYSRIRAEQGLLCLPVSELQRLIADLSLDAEILEAPLTYNSRRVHLLVHL
jgi:cyclopropane fatty-acyl-phospholipid synthase-like methyltransferase